MSKSSFDRSVRGLFTVLFAVLLVFTAGVRAQEKASAGRERVPENVMEGLLAKFPKAEIDKWTKEKEDEIVVYDIEFKQKGVHFEADIKEDGTIQNWEKAIEAKDLPAAVAKAVDKKYPNASMKEVMQVTEVKKGKDKLKGYEIGLVTADKKNVEVTVAPDGKILEDSGEEK